MNWRGMYVRTVCIHSLHPSGIFEVQLALHPKSSERLHWDKGKNSDTHASVTQ